MRERETRLSENDKRWPILPFQLLPSLITLLFVDSLITFLGFHVIKDASMLDTLNTIRWYIDGLVIPAEMVTCFELIYLVHKKRRYLHLCGIEDVSISNSI